MQENHRIVPETGITHSTQSFPDMVQVQIHHNGVKSSPHYIGRLLVSFSIRAPLIQINQE